MKVNFLIITAFIFGVIWSTDLNAQDDNRHKTKTEALDLSEKQEKEIQEIKLEKQKTIGLLKADLEIAQAELDKLMLADKISKNDVNSKIDAIHLIKANIQKERYSTKIEMKRILTDEQYAIFSSKHKHKNSHKPDGHQTPNGKHKHKH